MYLTTNNRLLKLPNLIFIGQMKYIEKNFKSFFWKCLKRMKIFSYLKPVAMILITKQEIKVKYVFGIIKSIDYE